MAARWVFSLSLAETSATRDDIYYVAAHIVRSVSCINQVLFALNWEYCLNEKRAVGLIERFPTRPTGYKERIDSIFVLVGAKPRRACAILRELLEEIRYLAA